MSDIRVEASYFFIWRGADVQKNSSLVLSILDRTMTLSCK